MKTFLSSYSTIYYAMLFDNFFGIYNSNEYTIKETELSQHTNNMLISKIAFLEIEFSSLKEKDIQSIEFIAGLKEENNQLKEILISDLQRDNLKVQNI